MSLPKIKHPIYAITLPSNQLQVNFRPFTVKEEKLLLMAKSSEKSEDIINSIKQVIQNCIIEKIDVNKLATFDVEYIFIKLRSKSVGEIIELEYTDNDSPDKILFKVNLDDVAVHHNPDHTNKFIVFDNIGIQMKYPTLEEMKLFEQGLTDENIFKILYRCIDKIYDDDTVYSEYTEDELSDFIESLPVEGLEIIKTFFETMPVLQHTVKLKNKQGETKEVVLKGINDFFTL